MQYCKVEESCISSPHLFFAHIFRTAQPSHCICFPSNLIQIESSAPSISAPFNSLIFFLSLYFSISPIIFKFAL